MKTYIFEGNRPMDFYPISQTRPVFDIRIGSETFLERICSFFKKGSVSLIVRKEIFEIASELHKNFEVNPLKVEDGLWLSGSVIWKEETLGLLNKKNTVFTCENDIVAANLSSELGMKWISEGELNVANSEGMASVEISVNKCNYLWDVLKLIPMTLNKESMELEPVNDDSFKDVIFSQKENIFVSNSQIMPNVVINAQNGPVIIDENTLIGSQSYLEGPVYIGPKTVISPLTKIKNSVIGPSCKIGGEIESSIIQGFTNKVHDGHLGDSFIGEWVNFGAGTTNSNLNNNYSTVKVSFREAEIDSKILHLGCFVGDHVKTAIGTLINTGSVIGSGSMIASPGLTPKTVPTLSWYVDRKFMNVKLDKFFNTVEQVKKRRNRALTTAEKNLYEKLQALN